MSFLPLLLAAAIADADPELVERLKRRDPGAMADLYDRYGRVVYAIVYRTVGNAATAEDLVQETFLRVWNRVHGFDGERGSLTAWLMAVARNRAIDYLRSAEGKARNAYELEETDHPSLFANLEHEVISSDSARRVREALQKLDDKQRRVIELAYFEGLSQSQMAEKLNQPLGTVKTWVRSALKALREQLAGAAAV